MARVLEIDGHDFRTLEEFFEVIGALLAPGQTWGKNPTAFNDLLSWPLAGGREPYVLVWRCSSVSRRRPGRGEAERHWEEIIRAGGSKPSKWQAEQLARASRCEGPTAFDWLVEIVLKHPDWLSLRLE